MVQGQVLLKLVVVVNFFKVYHFYHPFDICLNQGRLVGWIRVEEGCMRVGWGTV